MRREYGCRIEVREVEDMVVEDMVESVEYG